jgi:hypothetical protein
MVSIVKYFMPNDIFMELGSEEEIFDYVRAYYERCYTLLPLSKRYPLKVHLGLYKKDFLEEGARKLIIEDGVEFSHPELLESFPISKEFYKDGEGPPISIALHLVSRPPELKRRFGEEKFRKIRLPILKSYLGSRVLDACLERYLEERGASMDELRKDEIRYKVRAYRILDIIGCSDPLSLIDRIGRRHFCPLFLISPLWAYHTLIYHFKIKRKMREAIKSRALGEFLINL